MPPLSDDELQALRSYPQADLAEVDQAVEASFKDEMIQRTGGIPYDLTPYPCQAIVVRADGSTTDVAERLESGPVAFGRRGVGQFKPHTLPVTASLAVTDALHCGARLCCANVSAITITFAVSGDPLSGISDDFVVELARLDGAAVVQIATGGGVTNAHPAGHTRVAAGRIVQAWLHAGKLYLNGGTEP